MDNKLSKRIFSHIVPTKVENADYYLQTSKALNTQDKIFIPDMKAIKRDLKFARINATDLASNFANVGYSSDIVKMLLRDSKFNKNLIVSVITNDNKVEDGHFDFIDSINPYTVSNVCLRLSLQKDVNEKFGKRTELDETLVDFLNKNIKTVKADEKSSYQTISFGEYPQTLVNQDTCDTLERLYNEGNLSKELKSFGQSFIVNAKTYPYSMDETQFHQKMLPVFEYNGEKYVRIVSDNNLSKRNDWYKVEPISFRIKNYKDLTRLVNKKGKNKTATLELISEKSILSNLPSHREDVFSIKNNYGNVWLNSTTRAYLNGLDGEQKQIVNVHPYTINSGDCSNFGGFIRNAFDPQSEHLDEFFVSSTERTIIKNAFSGCVFLKKIHVPYNVKTIQEDAFGDINFKYCYRDKGLNYLTFATELPTNMDEIDCVVYLDSFTKHSYGDLLQGNFSAYAKISQVLKHHKLTLDMGVANAFVTNETPITEKVIEDLDNGEFSFFLNEKEKIFNYFNIDSTRSVARMLYLAYSLGAFSKEKVTDKFRVETSTMLCQKVCSFMATLSKNPIVERYFNGRYSSLIYRFCPEKFVKPNQDFFKFISTAGQDGELQNLELLFDLTKYDDSLIAEIFEDFDEVKSFRMTIDEKGLPRTLPWKEALGRYITLKDYGTKWEDASPMERMYARVGAGKEYFNQAKKLFEQSADIPSHLVSIPIKETMAEIDSLIAQTNQEFDKSKTLLDSAMEKNFTYEFLDKKDARNAIIGIYTNCCATLNSGLYGADIAKATITKPDLQNLVVLDKKGDIIAKGTMYVNRKRGFCVFNDFELNLRYRDDQMYSPRMLAQQQQIFDCFIRGIHAFVKQYNTENPTSPIKIVTVGRGLNKLEHFCYEYAVKKFIFPYKDLPVPQQYQFEDARAGQILLYSPADERDLNKEDSNESQSTNTY